MSVREEAIQADGCQPGYPSEEDRGGLWMPEIAIFVLIQLYVDIF